MSKLLKGKILLVVNDKENYYSNEEGIKILRKSNPKHKFRIRYCKDAREQVIQSLYSDGWLCLHD